MTRHRPPTDSSAPTPATLGDRLLLARRANFVGREAECARFARMLAGDAEAVWFLYGPGGIGKTTLLAELAQRAEAAGRIVLEIDARDLAPTPASWRLAMRAALTAEGDGSDAVVPPPGSVLLVDTFESIAALDTWLRDEELPGYPADVLVVVAGRAPADPQWRLEPGWASVATVTRLAPWNDDEARTYVTSRLGATSATDALLAQGAGLPLLLALLVDAHRRGAALPLAEAVAADPDLRAGVTREILVRFARDLADPALRAALDVLTVARSVSLPMLAETVDARTATDLYAWLAALPFVQVDQSGLQMHDFVRECFAPTWIARDVTAIARTGLEVQRHLARRAPLLGRDEAMRQLKDWVFVLRHTDVGAYVDQQHVDHYALAPLDDDGSEVLALVQRRQGAGLTGIARHWLQHRPQDFSLVRHRDGRLSGVLLALELTDIAPGTLAADTAAARCWDYVQRSRPPRVGGSACCIRIALDATSDELPNPTATLAGIWLTRRTLLDARAEWNLFLHHNAAAMSKVFALMTRLNWAHRETALDDVLDGRHYGAFVRDYVRDPIGPEWRPASVPSANDSPLLDRDGFTQAVRDALRNFTRDEALAVNPLRQGRAFARDGAPAELPTLRAALTDVIEALAAHPADMKFHRALRLTWCVPGAKQEAVAASLGLPFNTYRYHLARGAERVAQILWQRELLARGAK